MKKSENREYHFLGNSYERRIRLLIGGAGKGTSYHWEQEHNRFRESPIYVLQSGKEYALKLDMFSVI